MSEIIQLITNKIFLSALIANLSAQFLKMVILSYKEKRLNLLHFFELAGMPSAHTSTVMAITTVVYLETGVSTLFVLMLALSYYIIEEVLSMEHSIGKHAKIINQFIKLFSKKIKFKPIRERWGHTVAEVIAGFILGVIVAVLVYSY